MERTALIDFVDIIVTSSTTSTHIGNFSLISLP